MSLTVAGTGSEPVTGAGAPFDPMADVDSENSFFQSQRMSSSF
jgi:hypothetical protein